MGGGYETEFIGKFSDLTQRVHVSGSSGDDSVCFFLFTPRADRRLFRHRRCGEIKEYLQPFEYGLPLDWGARCGRVRDMPHGWQI